MGRARAVSKPAEDIVRFYTSLMGEAPFPSMTVALIESQLPGGHSPGFLVVVNEPLPTSENIVNWRSDPAWFDGFPEFFLAHELAHQWWGQAVGWKNYHEQWLSEGFAQYFAALYAQKTRGDKMFDRHAPAVPALERWPTPTRGRCISDTGSATSRTSRAFFARWSTTRAPACSTCCGGCSATMRSSPDCARFYEDRKFQKAGTDDLQRAFEAQSGRKLDRFFDRWIYGTDIPRVTYHVTTREGSVVVRFEQPADAGVRHARHGDADLRRRHDSGRRGADHRGAGRDRRSRPRVRRQVQVNRDNAALAEFDQR